MKLSGPMLVVHSMEQSKEFYKKVLRQRITVDFGANVTFSGGFSIQEEQCWKGFIHHKDVSFGGNDFELYFEEEKFDALLEHLEKFDLEYVNPVEEQAWGQRIVRFYDPDRHIIEVGENLQDVIVRFLKQGMTPEEVSEKTMMPLKRVISIQNKMK